MKKPVLFTQGGGQGAYEEDKKLARSLLLDHFSPRLEDALTFALHNRVVLVRATKMK